MFYLSLYIYIIIYQRQPVCLFACMPICLYVCLHTCMYQYTYLYLFCCNHPITYPSSPQPFFIIKLLKSFHQLSKNVFRDECLLYRTRSEKLTLEFKRSLWNLYAPSAQSDASGFATGKSTCLKLAFESVSISRLRFK